MRAFERGGRIPEARAVLQALVDDNAFHDHPNWTIGQVLNVTYGQNPEQLGPLLGGQPAG